QMNSEHRVDRMLRAVREFIRVPSVKHPLMPKTIGLPELGISSRNPLASISTGAGATNKRYPAEQWVSIGVELMKQGFQVALLGAEVDPQVEIEGAINLVGKLSLFETMSVVAGSKLHLAADTGTGHMAAAYGVPYVSIFGPTNPDLYRPYS